LHSIYAAIAHLTNKSLIVYFLFEFSALNTVKFFIKNEHRSVPYCIGKELGYISHVQHTGAAGRSGPVPGTGKEQI
jgi:hypothetical protein